MHLFTDNAWFFLSSNFMLHTVDSKRLWLGLIFIINTIYTSVEFWNPMVGAFINCLQSQKFKHPR